MPRSSKRWAAFSRSAFCASVDRVMRHKRITFYDACQQGSNPASNHKFCARTGSYLLRSGSHHSALRDATATVRFQHDLQQVHHVIIVDSLRYLGQQQIVLNVVKVAAQIKIYDARLALNDRLGYAVNCFMSCLLGTIPKRSRLEVSLKDRLQDELKRTLHHPITDRGNRKDADFAPVLRYLPLPSW